VGGEVNASTGTSSTCDHDQRIGGHHGNAGYGKIIVFWDVEGGGNRGLEEERGRGLRAGEEKKKIMRSSRQGPRNYFN